MISLFIGLGKTKDHTIHGCRCDILSYNEKFRTVLIKYHCDNKCFYKKIEEIKQHLYQLITRTIRKILSVYELYHELCCYSRYLSSITYLY